MPDPQIAFDELTAFLGTQEPLGLLTELALTFFFVPEGEFHDESSDCYRWQRNIEFLAGYYCARPYPDAPPQAQHNGARIHHATTLLENFFNAVEVQLLTQGLKVKNGSGDLLAQMKSYATHVRGMMYPHQYRAYAHALYAPHDAWFTKHLGFTIDDALKMAKAITDEYAKRNWDSKESSRQVAQNQADTFIKEGQACETDRYNIETNIGCKLHFGNATNLFAFTEEQLATFSDVPNEVAAGFLQRMSQEFGYRNSLFPDTFTTATSAPSDYNTLRERPIISHGGKYWLIVPPVMGSVLLSTFYFDLLNDRQYRPLFDKERATFLEAETATYLRRSFPANSVLLNPFYPNNEEMTDVLVLHDTKVIIVQCKSKLLTHSANVGESFEQLSNDIDEGIKKAFDQGKKATSMPPLCRK